jgi:dolichyl-phosphate-mannose-protein mannosyltransferase
MSFYFYNNILRSFFSYKNRMTVEYIPPRSSSLHADSFRHRVKKHVEYDSDEDMLLPDSKYDKLKHRRELIKSQSKKRDGYISLVLTIWAFYIRLWKLSKPSSVV